MLFITNGRIICWIRVSYVNISESSCLISEDSVIFVDLYGKINYNADWVGDGKNWYLK